MRILIALDGTPIGESAVVAVAPIAQATGAEIHLLTVVDPDAAETTFMPSSVARTSGGAVGSEPFRTSEPQAQTGGDRVEAFDQAREQGERFLQDIADRHLAGRSVAITAEIAVDTAETIVEKAEDFEVDFIAMGTRGRGGIGRAILGSVAEKVVREAPVPVLLVGPRMRSALADMQREERPAPQEQPAGREAAREEPATRPPDASQTPTPTLIDWLASADWQLRRQAKQELVARGPDVAIDVIDAAGSPNDNVRWGAVKVLHELRDERAIPVLIDLLEDENPTVRWAATEALSAIGRPVIVPILRRLLTNSGSVWLQEGAHHVLQRMVDPTISPVVNALEGPYPSITAPPRVNEALKELEGFA